MTDEFIDTKRAADWLAAHDQQNPKRSAASWLTFLKGNRVPSRAVAYRIPFEKVAGHNVYSVHELQRFMDAEQQRINGGFDSRTVKLMQAFGLNQGGGAYGRQWQGGSANIGVTNDGERFVQVQIKEPFMVIRMTPEQALSFSKELNDAGQAAIRQNASAGTVPDMSGYETVTDDKDILIQKRIEK